jgi:hypothetical protein
MASDTQTESRKADTHNEKCDDSVTQKVEVKRSLAPSNRFIGSFVSSRAIRLLPLVLHVYQHEQATSELVHLCNPFLVAKLYRRLRLVTGSLLACNR